MNVKDFAQQISTCTLDQKMTAAGKINKSIATKIGPDEKPLTDDQLKALQGLSSWLAMNIFIGNELCPVSSLDQYLK